MRTIQWRSVLNQSPDWILCLDADELFEDAIRTEIRPLIDQTEVDSTSFRLYDSWDAEHYREDGWWQEHRIYRRFLVRALADMPANWPDQPRHSGRFPPSAFRLSELQSEIRLKHLGWSTFRERHRTYERYRRLDPQAKWGVKKQHDSILDLEPTLRRWGE